VRCSHLRTTGRTTASPEPADGRRASFRRVVRRRLRVECKSEPGAGENCPQVVHCGTEGDVARDACFDGKRERPEWELSVPLLPGAVIFRDASVAAAHALRGVVEVEPRFPTGLDSEGGL
jgi:hypothetical protein